MWGELWHQGWRFVDKTPWRGKRNMLPVWSIIRGRQSSCLWIIFYQKIQNPPIFHSILRPIEQCSAVQGWGAASYWSGNVRIAGGAAASRVCPWQYRALFSVSSRTTRLLPASASHGPTFQRPLIHCCGTATIQNWISISETKDKWPLAKRLSKQKQFQAEESTIVERWRPYFVQACSVLARLSPPEYISSKWRIIFLTLSFHKYKYLPVETPLSFLLTAQHTGLLCHCIAKQARLETWICTIRLRWIVALAWIAYFLFLTFFALGVLQHSYIVKW